MPFISCEKRLRMRFREKLSLVEGLPTFPQAIRDLKMVMNLPHYTMDQIAMVIKSDPAITARLLKLANSAYYKRLNDGKEVTSVSYAVTRVGEQNIKFIVTTLGVFNMFQGPWKDFDRQKFWGHCLETALMAQYIEQKLTDKTDVDKVSAVEDSRSDDTYIAALLHDIGIVTLDQFFREEFAGILDIARRSRIPLHEIEEAMIGIDHGEVGAILTDSWNLPEAIVWPIRYHHRPRRAPVKFQRICAITNVADYICRLSEAGLADRYDESVSQDALQILGLNMNDLHQLSKTMAELIEQADILASIAA